LDRRLGGHKGQSGRGGEEKKIRYSTELSRLQTDGQGLMKMAS